MSRNHPAEQAPTLAVGALPPAVSDLLAAILEALDLPYPASVGHQVAHDLLLNERAMHAKIALRAVLDERPLTEIDWTTAYLRERLAEHPPTGYVTTEQARAAVTAGKSWSEAVALPGGEGQ
ncbi:hypothetical protein ACWCQZ_45440 [Streptomyces sp. NPDC002285]